MAKGPDVISMVLNRNMTLSTTMGHVIRFVKDKPINVPSICRAAAAEIGAVPTDGKPVGEEDAPKKLPVIDHAERREKILEAIELLVERNERGDFTAAGVPSVSPVNSLLDFRADAKEIALAWQARHDAIANDEE